jgi:hypothetical protein
MSNETDLALENMAYALGLQAYVWGFPVVVNEHSRLVQDQETFSGTDR